VHCSLSDAYLVKANSDSGLTELEMEALDDIQSTFGRQTPYGIPTSELPNVRYAISNVDVSALLLRSNKTPRYIQAPKRVYVLTDYDWKLNSRLAKGPGRRGLYWHEAAVILLHENGDSNSSWCRKTLIHETLHSVSLYSRIFATFQEIVMKHRFLLEGINEFFTGYVLFKRHPDCFENWKNNQVSRCAISYRDSVRLFSSLCQLVGIISLADFYFSQQTSFSSPWNGFVQATRTAGFRSFNYVLDERTAFRESDFIEVCVRSVPGFKEIYESDMKCFDFSKLE
jgi:hypothetical protein